MSGYLLDTNVLSEVIKKRPEPSVLARLREVAPGSVFTSVVCVTELRYGARRRPGAQVLWERIAREVLSRVRVLPFGEPEALRAGDLLADLEAAGQPIGIEDVLRPRGILQAALKSQEARCRSSPTGGSARWRSSTA